MLIDYKQLRDLFEEQTEKLEYNSNNNENEDNENEENENEWNEGENRGEIQLADLYYSCILVCREMMRFRIEEMNSLIENDKYDQIYELLTMKKIHEFDDIDLLVDMTEYENSKLESIVMFYIYQLYERIKHNTNLFLLVNQINFLLLVSDIFCLNKSELESLSSSLLSNKSRRWSCNE